MFFITQIIQITLIRVYRSLCYCYWQDKSLPLYIGEKEHFSRILLCQEQVPEALLSLGHLFLGRLGLVWPKKV
jgi:hypothetical protein